jgi:hypothetical protein
MTESGSEFGGSERPSPTLVVEAAEAGGPQGGPIASQEPLSSEQIRRQRKLAVVVRLIEYFSE